MIQAVERMDGDHFALGVQWHPEHLIYAKRQRAIFAALSEAASLFVEKYPARNSGNAASAAGIRR
jgi:putative glutamine amidotransferase